MDDRAVSVRRIEYRELFPWMHLFRAFQIAADPRKVLLAALGVAVLALGHDLISELPFAADADGGDQGFLRPWLLDISGSAERTIRGAIRDPLGVGWGVARLGGTLLLRPWAEVLQPGFQLLDFDASWSAIAESWTRLLWMLAVWSVFGGALTRMVAIQFAQHQKLSVAAAMGYALRRFLSYFAAPLIPLAGIGFFWLIGVVLGFLGRIPELGPVLVGLLYFVPLLLGLLMAVLLIGVAIGWPLSYAAISTENSDSFDGLSRSYSYLFDRPWHVLFYGLVALVYGAFVFFFVVVLAQLSRDLATWSVAWGLGPGRVPLVFPPAGTATADASAAAQLIAWWLVFLSLLVTGFVYSLFWTSVTIAYFLLRLSDDATALEWVAFPQGPSDERLPIVGMKPEDRVPPPDVPPPDVPPAVPPAATEP